MLHGEHAFIGTRPCVSANLTKITYVHNTHVPCPALIHCGIHLSDSSVKPERCPNVRQLRSCCPRNNLNKNHHTYKVSRPTEHLLCLPHSAEYKPRWPHAMETKTDAHYKIIFLSASRMGQQRFPELPGPLLDWEVQSRKEYSARRLPEASVTGLCSFWDSTPRHRISPRAEGEPITVPPVFNVCFSNTVVKTSFHKRVLVPYRNMYFHDLFSHQFFSKTCILLHLHYATRCLVFTESPNQNDTNSI